MWFVSATRCVYVCMHAPAQVTSDRMHVPIEDHISEVRYPAPYRDPYFSCV